MNLVEFFLAQLERESPLSRHCLERVPEGRADWKPHEKSMPLGYLSGLIATMPSWIAMMVDQDELDLNPPGGSRYTPPSSSTASELIKLHDESVSSAEKALRSTTDEYLMTDWKLLVAEKVVLEAKRYAIIGETFHHLAHHRGQLTVYLRLLNVPVPAIYGPSADEQVFG